MFAAPWIDHQAGWVARYQHPSLNMPDYGREMYTNIGIGALMLHLNFTNAQKETLLTRYVQLGIDFYGILTNGGSWHWCNDGGQAGGRKWLILFAGMVLNDTAMKSIGAKSGDYLYQNGYGRGNNPPGYLHFGEDDQTFYVAALDVSVTNGRHVESGFPGRREDSVQHRRYTGPPQCGQRATPGHVHKHSPRASPRVSLTDFLLPRGVASVKSRPRRH
jgi:hypothetical protein